MQEQVYCKFTRIFQWIFFSKLVKIWQNYGHEFVASLFWPTMLYVVHSSKHNCQRITRILDSVGSARSRVSAGTNRQCAHRRDILARHVAECCIHLPNQWFLTALDSKERQKLFETNVTVLWVLLHMMNVILSFIRSIKSSWIMLHFAFLLD